MQAQSIINRKFFLTAFFSMMLCAFSFSQGTWVQKQSLPGMGRFLAAGFSIGAKGYIGGNGKDFWEYDKIADTWTQKADYGGGLVYNIVGFSIGNKGYMGIGFFTQFNTDTNDLWEYNPGLNTWTQKAPLPALSRAFAIGFSIGSKGYVGCGSHYDPIINNWTFFNDFWEFDPVANTWTKKSDLPGPKRDTPIGFSIGNKGYIGMGLDTTLTKPLSDFWEWDQLTDTWIQKTNFPGGPRWGAYGYSIGNYGYVGMGADTSTNNPINDFWQYFPYANTWMQIVSFPGSGRFAPIGISIGCQGFFGTGSDSLWVSHNDWWQYFPDTLVAAVSGNVTLCSGDTASLYAFGGISFSWSTGETSQFINVSPSATTTYTVWVSDVCGSDTATSTLTIYESPVATFSYQPDLCGSGMVQFYDNSPNALTWNWDFGDGDSAAIQNPSHIYPAQGTYSVTLEVTGAFGCSDLQQFTVDVPPFSEVYIPTAFSPNNDGSNDIYYVFGSCITQMTFIIYNRWGEKVFETSDPATGWDGKYKGELQNAGVYLYSFDGTLTTGEQITKKGNITLIR